MIVSTINTIAYMYTTCIYSVDPLPRNTKYIFPIITEHVCDHHIKLLTIDTIILFGMCTFAVCFSFPQVSAIGAVTIIICMFQSRQQLLFIEEVTVEVPTTHMAQATHM